MFSHGVARVRSGRGELRVASGHLARKAVLVLGAFVLCARLGDARPAAAGRDMAGGDSETRRRAALSPVVARQFSTHWRPRTTSPSLVHAFPFIVKKSVVGVVISRSSYVAVAGNTTRAAPLSYHAA